MTINEKAFEAHIKGRDISWASIQKRRKIIEEYEAAKAGQVDKQPDELGDDKNVNNLIEIGLHYHGIEEDKLHGLRKAVRYELESGGYCIVRKPPQKQTVPLMARMQSEEDWKPQNPDGSFK